MNLQPIRVPYRYNEQDTPEQKVVYALGQLGEAAIADVISKLKQANPKEAITEAEAEIILKSLLDQGLIKGETNGDSTSYNLSKIVKPNSGCTNIKGIEDLF